MEGGEDEAVMGSGSFRVSDLTSKFEAVCHLALMNAQGTSRRSASGFFAKSWIGEKLEHFVMTNHHFIHTKEEAGYITATFHFDGKNDTKCVKLVPDVFFRTDKGTDYTMVGLCERDVDDLMTNHGISPVFLERVELFPKVGDQVFIAQHPEGKQKRFSSEKIREITTVAVGYKADTSFGSSGSPVIFGQGDKLFVLALHKSGRAKLKNGEEVNKGVLISFILDHVNGQNGPRSSTSLTTHVDESGTFANSTLSAATNQGLPVSHATEQQKSTDVKSELLEPHITKLVIKNVSHSTDKPTQEIQSPSEGPEMTQEAKGPPIQTVKQSCSKPFIPKELIRIAQRIPMKWDEIALCTGKFEKWEIDNIKLNVNYSSPVMQADRMLHDYKSRLGTRQDLVAALDLCKESETAELVRTGNLGV